MVQRTVIDPVMKHTEYTLTDLGRSLFPIIEQLRTWGDGFRSRLEEILREKQS